MDAAVTTGIFTIAGIVVTYTWNWAKDRAAGRSADRQKATDLLTQLARAIGTIAAEKAVFRERSGSWRPRLIATGSVLLQIGAAYAEGNAVKGMASGLANMSSWDATEGPDSPTGCSPRPSKPTRRSFSSH
jgi:hypothetical protein